MSVKAERRERHSPSRVEQVWLASLNGEIARADRTALPILDPGVLRGDGAFEVVQLYSGHPFALSEHLARLERSCASLLIECPREQLEEEIRALVQASGDLDGSLRIVLTRGGHRLCVVQPLDSATDRANPVALLPVTYQPTVILTGVKSLSYAPNMLALRLAETAGFGEALLIRPDGIVLEAATAAIFWSEGDRLRTPALDVGILASITRAILVDALEVEESEFMLADLHRADEAFLASTVRHAQPVERIGDHPLPELEGHWTQRAAEALRRAVEEEISRAGSRPST